MMLNCLLTGVGGQGTVLLSRLIAAAALDQGLDVRGSETIGMAQRGGSVVSHIRMGQGIFSPLIPPGKAGIIIAFEIAEALRVLPFLAPQGRMLVLDKVQPPAGANGAPYDAKAMLDYLDKNTADLTVLKEKDLLDRSGSTRVINVAVLGAALAKNFFPFTAEDVRKVLARQIPPAYLEMNIKALEIGGERGR
ncbi:pyruvate:ferredoxin (flavodoxin) oxidoreductase [Spirochaetia bacterium]|nr:pyruvate:ferredoxin (flavodoxin) oxidoreductase [Spirochaetia bacterium]